MLKKVRQQEKVMTEGTTNKNMENEEQRKEGKLKRGSQHQKHHT